MNKINYTCKSQSAQAAMIVNTLVKQDRSTVGATHALPHKELEADRNPLRQARRHLPRSRRPCRNRLLLVLIES